MGGIVLPKKLVDPSKPSHARFRPPGMLRRCCGARPGGLPDSGRETFVAVGCMLFFHRHRDNNSEYQENPREAGMRNLFLTLIVVCMTASAAAAHKIIVVHSYHPRIRLGAKPDQRSFGHPAQGCRNRAHLHGHQSPAQAGTPGTGGKGLGAAEGRQAGPDHSVRRQRRQTPRAPGHRKARTPVLGRLPSHGPRLLCPKAEAVLHGPGGLRPKLPGLQEARPRGRHDVPEIGEHRRSGHGPGTSRRHAASVPAPSSSTGPSISSAITKRSSPHMDRVTRPWCARPTRTRPVTCATAAR